MVKAEKAHPDFTHKMYLNLYKTNAPFRINFVTESGHKPLGEYIGGRNIGPDVGYIITQSHRHDRQS